jgi:2-enoate reductase
VEALDKLLALNGPLCHANSEMLERLVPFHGIEVITGAKASEFTHGELMVQVGNDKKVIPCDSVILSVGYKEEQSLYHELEFDVPDIHLLGDAKKVTNIMYSIWDAFEVANHI